MTIKNNRLFYFFPLILYLYFSKFSLVSNKTVKTLSTVREIEENEDPTLSRHSSVDNQNGNWDTDGSNHLSFTEVRILYHFPFNT